MKKFVLSFCFSVITILAYSQANPVSWSFGAEHVEGSKYLVKFIADIENNWVLYSQHIGEDGPIPTGFYFTDNADVKLVGKVEEKSKALKEMDDMFGMEVIKFKDQAVFEQLIELQTNTVALSGELEFMTCDGNRCLPPTTVEFTIKIE